MKLSNIFLKNGSIVIGDFGFSCMNASSADSLLGSPYYMAPEILNNSHIKYNNKVDIWSIGVCFYYLLYKKYPFNGKNE